MSRELTSHRVNGLNEAIRIEVMDEPGAGGACHEYRISFEVAAPGTGEQPFVVDVNFQNGPIAENGVNGISQEALLAIVEDRLNSFQNGPYSSEDNGNALHYVRLAVASLHNRTKARMARGVEGTSIK